MTQISIAFIGAGYMASEHAKAFSSLPGVKLAGVFSRGKERAQTLAATYHMPHVCSSIDELYEKTRADLLILCVPELAAKDICAIAFKFPWKILAEKPLGHNLAEAKEIQQMAHKADKQIFLAFNRRHYTSTRNLLNEMKDVAGPRLIQVFDQEDQISARKAGQPEAVVQNWMYANSIHMIDFFRTLGRGEITQVEPVVKWNPQNPSFVVSRITYASGDIGIYQAVWNAPGPWAVTVTTPSKRWEMRPVEQLSVQIYGSRKAEPIEGSSRDVDFKPGLLLQAQETVKALQGQPHSLPTLEDSMKTMELVNKLYS